MKTLESIVSQLPMTSVPSDCMYHIYRALWMSTRSYRGDIAECGCLFGETSLQILNWMKATNTKRTLHLFDTFTGFPPIETQRELEREVQKYPLKSYLMNSQTGELTETDYEKSIGLKALKKRLKKWTNVKYHKGLFSSTFPKFNTPLSFVFADCDLEESITQTIELADRLLLPGGVILFHDFGSPAYPGVEWAINDHLDINKYWLIKPKKLPEDAEFGIAIAIKL